MTLQEISNRFEIQDLMIDYCRAIDSRNLNLLDDVFTNDGIVDYTEMVGVKGSLPEIKKILAEELAVIEECQHRISTSEIAIEGDRGYGRTICTNPKVDKLNDQLFCVGVWNGDDFVRTEKGWRISSRYEESSWRYDLFQQGSAFESLAQKNSGLATTP